MYVPASFAGCANDEINSDLFSGKWMAVYTGDIDKKYQISMVLTMNRTGDVKGEYYYNKYMRDIKLTGVIKNAKDIIINVQDKNIVSGELFDGKIQSVDPRGLLSSNELTCEVIAGVWKKGGTTLPFYLRLQREIYGELGKWYSSVGVYDDVDYENKLKKIISAIYSDNIKYLSWHIRYPLRVKNNSTGQYVQNNTEFRKKYDAIFTKEFKTILSNYHVHKLFHNEDGVMYGAGELWFDAQGRIITINN